MERHAWDRLAKAEQDAAVEAQYQHRWAHLVETDGVLDPAKVKAELFDYANFMDQASEVYMAVSGHRISKPNTMAVEVIAQHERVVEEAVQEALTEARLHNHQFVRVLVAQVRAAVATLQAGGELYTAKLDGRLMTDRLLDTCKAIEEVRENHVP